MPIIEAQFQVPDEGGGRVDRIVQELTGRSRADVRGLFDHRCVMVNGTECLEAGMLVKAGDIVAVRHDPHRRYHERPREREGKIFRLVFEDEHLIVIDKAAPYLTVPTERHETNTVFDALNRHVSRKRPRSRVSVVHRLDRGTSGLLVFGKSAEIARELQNQFRARKTEREYAAIVAGNVEQSEGTFSSRLGTTKSLQRYSVRGDEEGELAVTHYRVERRMHGATYVRVRLETGKRNQIRVHFAEAGHPVLGDQRYRPELAFHPKWTSRHLALHALRLAFTHPKTKHEMKFESPLPEEFTRFLNQSVPNSSGEAIYRKRRNRR